MLFRERLNVPLMWWVLALGLAVSFVAAFGFYLGWGFGFVAGGVTMVIAGGLFWSAGVVISVEPTVVRIGRAEIDVAYVGGAQALDVEQTRKRSGPEADARAHLVLRPYVATAVELTLDDPADRVPYWLVSSRRPTELARALEQARTGAGIG